MEQLIISFSPQWLRSEKKSSLCLCNVSIIHNPDVWFIKITSILCLCIRLNVFVLFCFFKKASHSRLKCLCLWAELGRVRWVPHKHKGSKVCFQRSAIICSAASFTQLSAFLCEQQQMWNYFCCDGTFVCVGGFSVSLIMYLVSLCKLKGVWKVESCRGMSGEIYHAWSDGWKIVVNVAFTVILKC